MTAEVEIRRRIQQQGVITFAEYMDVALYWPDGGYYTSAEPFGASGDYYTSPMAHPAFGALLLNAPALFTTCWESPMICSFLYSRWDASQAGRFSVSSNTVTTF